MTSFLSASLARRFRDQLPQIIEQKISLSGIIIKHDSFIANGFRVLKHMSRKVSIRKPLHSTEIHVSMPYYKKDVMSIRHAVHSLDEFSIEIHHLFFILWIYIYLFATIKLRPLRAYIASVIAIAYGNYISLKRLSPTEIHFHGYAYVPEFSTLIYLFANCDETEAHHHEYVSFLDESIHVIADHIHYTNDISSHYAKNNAHKYCARHYHHEVSLAEIAERAPVCPSTSDKIGIYMTGFYARMNHNYFERAILEHGEAMERKMLRRMLRYAGQHPEIRLIIFPHYRRGVETLELAYDYYKPFLTEENVSLYQPIENSISPILDIELGITVCSNIFWDRLLAGKKTVLVNPVMFDQFVTGSAIKGHHIESDEELFDEFITSRLSAPFGAYAEIMLTSLKSRYSDTLTEVQRRYLKQVKTSSNCIESRLIE